jgi:integrase
MNRKAASQDGFSTILGIITPRPRTWRRVLATANVGHVRWHDLRHAHATLMLASGVHPKIVSERLGHASVGITLDTYSHVLPGLQAAAAEALDSVLAVQVLEEAQ